MNQVPRFVPSLELGEILAAVLRGREGPEDALERFSRRFAEYIGVRFAIPAPSGRVALAGALKALGLEAGSEILVPGLTFHSVPAMLVQAGLRPRFVDIDGSTFCLDPGRLEDAVSGSTSAIMPVHLYGRACDMAVISEVAARHDLTLIEDCAQGCGGSFQGQRLGSFGRAAFFSFAPAKSLSALWAGMVTTDDSEVARQVSRSMASMPSMGSLTLAGRLLSAVNMRLATHGPVWSSLAVPFLRAGSLVGFDPIEWLVNESPGTPDQLDPDARLMPGRLQGRLGLSQLQKLDESNRRRIHNGERLRHGLKGTPGVGLPGPSAPGENIYLSFVIKVPHRDRFRRELLHRGVDTHPGNLSVGPRLPGLADTGQCPVAQDVVQRLVHLPVHPQMTDRDVDRVIESVRAAAAAGNG